MACGQARSAADNKNSKRTPSATAKTTADRGRCCRSENRVSAACTRERILRRPRSETGDGRQVAAGVAFGADHLGGRRARRGGGADAATHAGVRLLVAPRRAAGAAERRR